MKCDYHGAAESQKCDFTDNNSRVGDLVSMICSCGCDLT